MSAKKTKGVGKKLAVYVPKCDEYVVDELERLGEKHSKEGYRTSLSFELIRMAKIGLVASANKKIMSTLDEALRKANN